jgi:diguanylate cyclase (GGDEF)-like protein
VTQALLEAEQATVLDALTGLPNRTALLERLAQVLAGAKRQGLQFALLFLDLDNFKPLNDQHGHVFGDQVLCLAAARMLSVVREVDTVSRHGGDEFLILLPGLHQPGDAQTVAGKLIAAIGAPMTLDGRTVSVTASVGIALYPEDGDTPETLVARADAAMYEAKRRRTGVFAFHGGGNSAGAGRAATPSAEAQSPASRGASDAAKLEHRLSQLREANEQLVVSALGAQQLQAAAEQAQQRQAAFLAAVADELRNPLAPIRIATAMLGRQPADEPLLARVQGIVAKQMAHMSRLVDAANGNAGGLQLDHQPVDLAQVIDAAMAALRPLLDERRQRFEYQRPDGTLVVQGDALALHQIVGNLLDNASKHTHHGGRIGLSVAADAETLVMTVSDDGIGITPAMLHHVFEPFVQDTHALGFNGDGLGIGLTVVRALVQAHGGTLTAHSEGIGCGSEFVVTLPRALGVEAAGGAADTAGPGR